MFCRLESFCVLCDILHSVIGGTCTRFTQIGPLINYMWRFVLSFYSLFSICIPNTKTVQELFSKFLEKVIQFSVQSEKLSIARENRWKLLNKHRWQVYFFSLHIYFFFLHTHALTAAYFEREFGGLLERHTLKRELHMNRKIPQCSCHFPYFDKNISITHWKSAGSWSRPLWGKNVKRIHGLEASYLLQRSTKALICSRSRARIESLIAQHTRRFWLAPGKWARNCVPVALYIYLLQVKH